MYESLWVPAISQRRLEKSRIDTSQLQLQRTERKKTHTMHINYYASFYPPLRGQKRNNNFS